MFAGFGPALSFLSDESAICSHIVEKEYGGLRMKTPDVEFKVGSHTRTTSAKCSGLSNSRTLKFITLRGFASCFVFLRTKSNRATKKTLSFKISML